MAILKASRQVRQSLPVGDELLHLKLQKVISRHFHAVSKQMCVARTGLQPELQRK